MFKDHLRYSHKLLIVLQDPTEVIDKYGADALRLYLINSPVVRANNVQSHTHNTDNMLCNISPQDPTEVIDKYGADALRLYLINSPVVRAETLRFREEGVFGVVKDVFLPWYNAYR